jgi:NADH-quinone oxidoreductase subunit L
MGGLKKYLPVTYITFFIGVLAISGIPPFAGFFSKDEILASAFAQSKTVWTLALLTSLLTVFYMFRLFFLTFFGSTRASSTVLDHIHESPRSMIIPLLVLALLSVVGGFIGVPEVLGGSHWLGEFLSPVFVSSKGLIESHHLSKTMEITLMGVVVFFTLVLIGIAYNRYVSNNHVPVSESKLLNPLQLMLSNKYYVDEFYDFLIVKPLYRMSEVIHARIERLGIDKLVNTIGKRVISLSRAARFLQAGSIGYYIMVMVIGVVAMLAFTVMG